MPTNFAHFPLIHRHNFENVQKYYEGKKIVHSKLNIVIVFYSRKIVRTILRKYHHEVGLGYIRPHRI